MRHGVAASGVVAMVTVPALSGCGASGGDGSEEPGSGGTAGTGRRGIVVVMGHGRLYGVDLDSRRKVWSAPGDFQEGAVSAGDTVVGPRLDEGRHRPAGGGPRPGDRRGAVGAARRGGDPYRPRLDPGA